MTYTKDGKNDVVHKFTLAQLDTMRQMFEAGEPYKRIAVALGLRPSSFRTISRRCQDLPDESHGKRARAGRRP